MTGMRVCVSGVAGRVGQQLARDLHLQGHQVFGFDKRPAPTNLPATVEVIDLGDHARLAGYVAGADGVVHLAALMSWDPRDDRLVLTANVQGTGSLLAAVEAACPEARFVFASSGEVYPESLPVYQPLDEAHPTEPRTLYGLSKLMGEELVKLHGRTRGLDYTIMRLPHTQQPAELLDPNSFFSGPRFYLHSRLRRAESLGQDAVAEILRPLAGSHPEPLLYVARSAEGTPYRMPIADTRDVATGLRLALESPSASGLILNLGPPTSIGFDEAIAILAAHTGLDHIDVDLPGPGVNYETSIRRAQEVLLYKPTRSFADMVAEGAAAVMQKQAN